MKSKQLLVFFFLFFIIIFSGLTFSSKEKEHKKRKRRQNYNIVDPHRQNSLDRFLNTFDFIQPNASSNTQNVETQFNFSDLLKTKEETNFNVPSNLLKAQETQNSDIHIDLSKIYKNAESSCNLLDLNPNLFRHILAYLSLFELELNFKCASTQVYNLYEKFLKQEKQILTEMLKNESIFLKNINCTRVYFDFFEKRFWNEPDRIEYANVDSFSSNLIIFPKSIRQIVWFKYNEVEYKYVLFKNGDVSILQKIKKKENFVFAYLENDKSPTMTCNLSQNKIFKKLEDIRWMNFIESKCHSRNRKTTNACFEVRVDLYTTDNFTKNIWHNLAHHQNIMISEISFQTTPIVFFKNITGCVKLESDGSLRFWKFEKQKNGKYSEISSLGHFQQDIKEIKSQDFEHYAHDVSFIFKN